MARMTTICNICTIVGIRPFSTLVAFIDILANLSSISAYINRKIIISPLYASLDNA